jgi:hypothetical protein
MGRYFSDNPPLLRQFDQYVYVEHRPDLYDDATAIGVVDPAQLAARYLKGNGRLLARRDLVEVAEVPPAARLLFDDGQLRVYASDDTVATAAPGALVRCELIVAWTGAAPDDSLTIRGTVDGGDTDVIGLRPYLPGPTGIERRALLLGAPPRAGTSAVTLEVMRGDQVLYRGTPWSLDITTDPSRAAAAIATDPSPQRAAHRLAWLREQSIARAGMTRFHLIERALIRDDAAHRAHAGRDLLRLRWEARLASFETLPASLRATEMTAARRLLATCPAGNALCLGRTIDELRRYGYLGVLDHVPETAAALANARASRSALPAPQRYAVLVGLVLADPSDMTLVHELLDLRRTVAPYPDVN